MENFVVSARKHRPQSFEAVVGQEHITTTLQNAIKNNQLAQALLFCGPRGVGKTTCARILARTINGFEDNEKSSLNIFELDAASNNSVEDIRNLIDQVRYPPQYGNYKVYIIDEVHMLSNAAFNAFLKTLEEPPEYAIFILATTEKHKVIPTILSRCQIYDFNRIQIKEIVAHLKNIAKKDNIEAEEDALHLIAQKADGALRDALSLFDLIKTFSSEDKITYESTLSNLHILDYDYYFKVTDALYNQDVSTVLLTFDEILQKGFDGHNFITGMSEHFRNILVCKDPETIKLLDVSENVQQRYKEQSQNVSTSFLLSALNLANQCDLQYKGSKNQRLHVELTLMKIGHLPSLIKVGGNGQPAEAGEKKNSSVKQPDKATAEPEPAEKKTPPPTEPETSVTKEAETQKATPTPPVVEEPKEDIPSMAGNATQNGTGPKINVNMKGGFNIPKLNDLTKEEEPKEAEKPKKEEPVILLPEDTDVEALKKLVDEYAAQKEAAGKMNDFITLKDKSLSLEDGSLVIQLDNQVQAEQFNSLKSDLLGFIKSKTDIKELPMVAKVIQQENKKMIYTAQEKFDHLAEKHPKLNDLKDKLGLETDF